MLCRLISGGLALATTLGISFPLVATDSTLSPVVVCTREIGKPWSLLAHGELVRMNATNRTGYELRVREHTFLYTVESNADGSSQTPFPPSLSLISLLREKFQGQTTPRGPIVVPVTSSTLSVDPEGNIREYIMLPNLGPLALITVTGSACPPGKD